MTTQIQWIPFGELVLEPERLATHDLSVPGRPNRTNDPSAMVMVTPDRRVIAGRAYLRSCGIGGQDLIPCRVVHPDDLDVTLTALHNTVLYRPLDSEALRLHLEIYAELCRHLQIRATREERRQSAPAETPGVGNGSLRKKGNHEP